MKKALTAGRLRAAFLLAAALALPSAVSPTEPPPPEEPLDGAAVGSPRIVAVSDSHDFGEVEEGSVVSHIFVIRNEGDAPLRILGAKGS